MTKKCNRLRGERPKAFWGALVGGAMNLIGSAISSKAQARAIRRQIEAQKEAARTQLELANNSNLASTLNSYATATRSYNDEDYYNWVVYCETQLENVIEDMVRTQILKHIESYLKIELSL